MSAAMADLHPSSSSSSSSCRQETEPMMKEWIDCGPLGEGSFARVSLALEPRSGQLFAAKWTPGHAGGRPSAELLSLMNEADILGSLPHSPFIIPLYGAPPEHSTATRSHQHSSSSSSSIQEEDAATHRGSQFTLFLQFMDLGSLHDLIRRSGGKLPEARAASIAGPILKGLEYLHANRVVHCDIKSRNILLNSKGEVKIGDFGASQRLGLAGNISPDNPDSCPSFRGTPLWMAPEVLLGIQQGPPSDIWSFGCTLVEMLQGRPPYGHISGFGAALFKIASSSSSSLESSESSSFPPLPPSISACARDFLLRCLHPNPSLRWTASQLLNHPFICDHIHTIRNREMGTDHEDRTSDSCSKSSPSVAARNQSSPRSTLRFDDCLKSLSSSSSSESLTILSMSSSSSSMVSEMALSSARLSVDESATTSILKQAENDGDDDDEVKSMDFNGDQSLKSSNGMDSKVDQSLRSSNGMDSNGYQSLKSSIGMDFNGDNQSIKSSIGMDFNGDHQSLKSSNGCWITVRTSKGWNQERAVEPFIGMSYGSQYSPLKIPLKKGSEVSLESAAFLQSSNRRR